MADNFVLDLSELRVWERVLVRAGITIEKVVDVDLNGVGKEVQAAAKASAPVDTGELAGSIYLRGGKGWRKIGSDERQGFFQEFGTSEHGPQPWLFANGDRGGAQLEKLLTVSGVKVLL